MPVQDYKPMDSAPMDGTVVLVLADSREPRAAYYETGDYPEHKGEARWRFWHDDEPCYPAYWTAVPADPPSDYLPQLKSLEDELTYRNEVRHGLEQDKLYNRGPYHPSPRMAELYKENAQEPIPGEGWPKDAKAKPVVGKATTGAPPPTPKQEEDYKKAANLAEAEKKSRDEFPKNTAYYAEKAKEKAPPFAPPSSAPSGKK
jgi:hypothetical protein